MHQCSVVEVGDANWRLFTACSHQRPEPQEGVGLLGRES